MIVDGRPTVADYAYLSQNVYEDNIQPGTNLENGWVVSMTINLRSVLNGYIARVYYNKRSNHLVVAHRGTKFSNFGSVWTDAVGIAFNRIVSQVRTMVSFISIILRQARENNLNVSFTGHSLGGWLAQISMVLLNNDEFQYGEQTVISNAVTFDAPSARKFCIRWLMLKYGVGTEQDALDILEDYDIGNILFYPNLINTTRIPHVGNIYHAQVILGKQRKKFRHVTHEMEGMLRLIQNMRVMDSVRNAGGILKSVDFSRFVPMKQWIRRANRDDFYEGAIRNPDGPIHFGYKLRDARWEELQQYGLIRKNYIPIDDGFSLLEALHFNKGIHSFLRELFLAQNRDEKVNQFNVRCGGNLPIALLNALRTYVLYRVEGNQYIQYHRVIDDWDGFIIIQGMDEFEFRYQLTHYLSLLRVEVLDEIFPNYFQG